MFTLKVAREKPLMVEETSVSRRGRSRTKKISTGITEVEYTWEAEDFRCKSDTMLCRSAKPRDYFETFCTQHKRPTMRDVDVLIRNLFPRDNTGTEIEMGVLRVGKATLPNAQRIYAAGGQYDCLVHSILTCCCPHFRRVGDEPRVYFAREFRTVLMPRLIQTYDKETRPDLLQQTLARFTSATHEFLTDSDFNYFMNFFRMCALCFQKGGRKDKPQVNEIGFDCTGDPIVVYGDLQHFEPVRINGSYTLPRRDVARVLKEFRGEHFDMHDSGYKFDVRDRVVYKGVSYAVAQRRSEPLGKRDLIKVYYLLPIDEVESFSDGYLDKTNFHEWRPDRITRALEDDVEHKM
jgi:hypothetical protein